MALSASIEEQISQIDWATLPAVSGSSLDVPVFLRTLFDPATDEVEIERSFAQLAQTLEHQGSVGPVTVAAIPFLVELVLVSKTRPNLQCSTLYMLRDLAIGPDDLSPTEIQQMLDGLIETDPSSDEYAWQMALRDCYVAVEQSFPRLLELFRASTADVVTSLLELCKAFPRTGPVWREHVERLSRAGSPHFEEAQAVLDRLTSPSEYDVQRAELAKTNSTNRRLQIACTLVRINPSRVDIELLAVLIASFEASDELQQRGDESYYLLLANQFEPTVRALSEVLAILPVGSRLTATHRLLSTMFQKGHTKAVTQLSSLGRFVLKSIVTHGDFDDDGLGGAVMGLRLSDYGRRAHGLVERCILNCCREKPISYRRIALIAMPSAEEAHDQLLHDCRMVIIVLNDECH